VNEYETTSVDLFYYGKVWRMSTLRRGILRNRLIVMGITKWGDMGPGSCRKKMRSKDPSGLKNLTGRRDENSRTSL
jgi:hypothetical protein